MAASSRTVSAGSRYSWYTNWSLHSFICSYSGFYPNLESLPVRQQMRRKGLWGLLAINRPLTHDGTGRTQRPGQNPMLITIAKKPSSSIKWAGRLGSGADTARPSATICRLVVFDMKTPSQVAATNGTAAYTKGSKVVPCHCLATNEPCQLRKCAAPGYSTMQRKSLTEPIVSDSSPTRPTRRVLVHAFSNSNEVEEQTFQHCVTVQKCCSAEN